MNFENLNLNTPLINALNDMEYFSPTPIQENAFPVIMSGADVVGLAQTGTGKTFAYLLPLLRKLKFSEQKHPRILIVVPTRELTIQVKQEIEKLSKYITLRVGAVYGGTNINTQKKMTYRGLDVVVATPGRLMDIVMLGMLRLKSIQSLVIDEVDEMMNLGFRLQLVNIMENLPKKRQNLMFSATLTEDVETFIEDYFLNPKKIKVAEHGTPLEKITQHVYKTPNFKTKINLLKHFLSQKEIFKKVLIFAGNKKSADRVFKEIGTHFPNEIGVIHSNKAQNNRINTLNKFIDGTFRMLSATDIAARGLDISDVTHVINFDTPETPGDYLHRIGRTGRADKDGIAITFVSELEEEFMVAIEVLMNKEIEEIEIPEGVEISNSLLEFEKEKIILKDHVKRTSFKDSKGAFHEKSEKNQQENSGSPSFKRKPRRRISKKRR